MGAYNYKVTEYEHSTKITKYARPIVTGHKRQSVMPDTQSERTPEQIKHSLQTSLNRTKNMIFELAKSNNWEYFITFTFDPKKYDSTNYDTVTGLLKKFIDNIRHNKAHDLIYLIVPELHSDGEKFHFHGLLAHVGNIEFQPSGKIDSDGEIIYNLSDWKYGFSTATPIKDTARASAYITKYITKECIQHTKHKKRYYCSRNIKRPAVSYHNNELPLEKVISLYNPDYVKTINMPHAYNRVTHMEIDD